MLLANDAFTREGSGSRPSSCGKLGPPADKAWAEQWRVQLKIAKVSFTSHLPCIDLQTPTCVGNADVDYLSLRTKAAVSATRGNAYLAFASPAGCQGHAGLPSPGKLRQSFLSFFVPL